MTTDTSPSPHTWTTLTNEPGGTTAAMPLPGGVLLRTSLGAKGEEHAVALCFLSGVSLVRSPTPDPHGEPRTVEIVSARDASSRVLAQKWELLA